MMVNKRDADLILASVFMIAAALFFFVKDYATAVFAGANAIYWRIPPGDGK